MSRYGPARISCSLCLVLILATQQAGAQQFIDPAKGQTAEQQKADEAACDSWTVGQPASIRPSPLPPPRRSSKGSAGAQSPSLRAVKTRDLIHAPVGLGLLRNTHLPPRNPEHQEQRIKAWCLSI